MASTSSIPQAVSGIAIDPTVQMNTYRSYVSVLADAGSKEENRLKAAQAINEELEAIITSPQYPAFLDHAIKTFLKILGEGTPLYISEHSMQQLRKLILDIINRLPCNEHLKIYMKPIFHVLFKLLETDNEENVMVCLHAITELHKTFRPPFSADIQKFLQFVKNMYKELPHHIEAIFAPREQIRVHDIPDVNIAHYLGKTYTVTPIYTEKLNADDAPIVYNLIPKATMSLKVLTELPIIFVLMLQLYKDQVYSDVIDFIPLIMDTIILEPNPKNRLSDNFNKEVFVDLVAAQIKILSFLAYIVKTFQENVLQYHVKLVKGMLNLLDLCPDEVASLRRELLIATKHILALELRNKFTPYIDRLFDDKLLFGKGYTAHETLRPLAYSTLADLIHHIRSHLTLPSLSRAVHLFSKNIHDDSLPTSIQTMSCKLLLNLVDCIRSKNADYSCDLSGQDLLIRMLHVFVNKFKSIAKLQIPMLKAKLVQQNSSDNKEDKVNLLNLADQDRSDSSVKRYPNFPHTSQNYSIVDWRALVKTLVTGVKTITWGCSSCKTSQDAGAKAFSAKDTLVYIRFTKWATQALEIYSLPSPTNSPRPPLNTPVRTKEEKETLEHFAGVYVLMNNETFKEIFTKCMPYIVERLYLNPALQIVANSFLARPDTSPIFATILIEYLLKHMEEMGGQTERASLYLKLFKLVFGSVSILASDNELMLKPYLHEIVNRSMELAMVARDPYNYFLLLRALFRSIGGGNHDILYQEFLPLLPNLLQGLNSLQSGLHKQHMKDLFVELCLTVPVRLSSLLPYLPMLMDPLVSALNGSQTLISQGLRTLELCVDNLQPDFLYDHIQPVRAELMHALWKTMRNPNEHISQVTFRVLGKFGGGNRKMITEPQKIDYREVGTYSPRVLITFTDQDKIIPVSLPVEKIIETAFTALKISNTEPWYRIQCWEIIRGFLLASMPIEADRVFMYKLFTDGKFKEGDISSLNGQYYKYHDEQVRHVHQTAFTAMYVAAAIKELRSKVLRTMVALVRHYTMLSIAQQAGPFNVSGKWHKVTGMDPLVMIDALAVIMGHEEKELCKAGHLALVLIMNAATDILGSKERACQLPLMEYLADKMCGLCYERAWYAKFGGCIAIKLLFENMALKWVLEHQYMFLRALLFVMMDLTDEVSTGAVEKAKSDLEKMLHVCAQPLEGFHNTEEMKIAQDKSLYEVTRELIRHITSPNTTVREQSMQSLRLLASLTKKDLTEVIRPHQDLVSEMIPPKKQYILRHQPTNIQIGLMEGNAFCHTLEPGLFTIDLDNNEHKSYHGDLSVIVEKDDTHLARFNSYKNVKSFVPLRKSAIRALSACNIILKDNERMIQVMCRVLNTHQNIEIQEAAFECIQKIQARQHLNRESSSNMARPLLVQFMGLKALNMPIIQRLSFFARIFPNVFQDKIIEQLLGHMNLLTEQAVRASSLSGKPNLENQEIKLYTAVLNLFHQIPNCSASYVENVCKRVLQTEQSLVTEAASTFRTPLLKFCNRYPAETIQLFLSDSYSCDDQWGRLLEYFIKHENGEILRTQLCMCGERLLNMIVGASVTPMQNNLNQEKAQQMFLAVRIVYLLSKKDLKWITGQNGLVMALHNTWKSQDFQERHRNGEDLDVTHWKLPRMIVSILLMYFKQNPDDIKLLFSLLEAFNGRYIVEYHFLKDFLEQTVACTYSVQWKRRAFFQFYEIFEDNSVSEELKACILRHVIIPCMNTSLDRGEGEQLIGYSPSPDENYDDSLISVIINKIINPDDPFRHIDHMRILLLQLSSLLVEKAPAHIHEAANKRQGIKLRRLMTYAWPCLLSKSCVDPATKYHGHLLLSHIIAKFAIHKRIVLQVFHSLLKAHAVEARIVVRQALEILTPAMPARMEDGNTMLTHWTKKILIEEGHTVGQLVHILSLIVKHSNVYYPVRHHLLPHISQSMQKLGFTQSANIDQRRLAVDLAEICIKWEERRIEELKRVESEDNKALVDITDDINKPIDKVFVDNIVYFLLRLACQINESTATPGTISQGDALSKRTVALLKRALCREIWPYADPKLMWMEKFFLSYDGNNHNVNNISVGLELLTYLLGTMRHELILPAIKSMTKGLLSCISYFSGKFIKLIYAFVAKLMSIFPTTPGSLNLTCGHEDLDELYSRIAKMVYDGLTNYDRTPGSNPSTVYGPMMLLKAACQSNPAYVDRLLNVVMKVLQRIAREHLNPSNNNEMANTYAELLITSLDIARNRISVMNADMRKALIGGVMMNLIDKTMNQTVMKTLLKIVDEWFRVKWDPEMGEGPTLREKSILVVRLGNYVEKKFVTDDQEILHTFLELVLFIYTDPVLNKSELSSKLEPAFLAGLRSSQPLIRQKFFQEFHNNMPQSVYERIMYIICSQNWENMGPHYWIKQCIEILLSCANEGNPLQQDNPDNMLPPISAVIEWSESSSKADFYGRSLDEEEFLTEATPEKDMDIDMEMPSVSSDGHSIPSSTSTSAGKLKSLVFAQCKFFSSIESNQFLSAVSQLCHMDSGLADWVMVQLFPAIWKGLPAARHKSIGKELIAFLTSGAHLCQKDCHPSAVTTFAEAISQCVPKIPMRVDVKRYMGKTYNLWHRMVLEVEQAGTDLGITITSRNTRREYESKFETLPFHNEYQAAIDNLSELYSLLGEEDLWAGLWQTCAAQSETKLAVSLQQHGFMDKAQGAFQIAMSKLDEEYHSRSFPARMNYEVKMFETQIIKCTKELNQWEAVMTYGASEEICNPMAVLDSAWHVDNWQAMKEAMNNIEQNYPRESAWKISLYRGYLAIMNPDSQHLSHVEKLVEIASNMCIKEWKRLPHIVSHIHLQYLQAAQQIMELQEACQIHQGLLQGRSSTMHDMKAIVKTWRNRLPVLSDELRHWSDVFTWRQHHYNAIVRHYTDVGEQPSHSMLGVHASAQAIIHFGKIARKHYMTTVCLDSLSKIHSIQSVPIVDCFQKIRQQVKCYLQMSLLNSSSRNELQEGLEVIESTNFRFFTKEMVSEFHALKGLFHMLLNRMEDANRCYSSALQLHDNLVKAWGLWGEFNEQQFTKDPEQMKAGVSAMVCYLHACRHTNEYKTRKFLAKVFWLLSYDNNQGELGDMIERYGMGVPPIQWLAWVPQLLTCLIRPEGRVIIPVLNHVGKIFPQAVYLPIRTLYLTLRIEQRGRFRRDSSASQNSQNQSQEGQIRATEAMRRCSRVLGIQREVHPTVLVSLEGIAEQMLWFRENWYEEVVRQLRQALGKCYAIAFENSGAVMQACVTPHTQQFVKKLVQTFGIGFENVTNASSSQESLVKRAQVTHSDPLFNKLKSQFQADFDFSQPGAMQLHNLIKKLKKWIKILEAKIKLLPKWFLIEEKCRFLSNFNLETAEVELPGEFLLPKQSNYYVKIARFLPRVDIVQKHGTSSRRLYIRGHNGRIYPFLVVSDSSLSDGCREERLLQLLRMLNCFFHKQKETSKRHVNMYVSKVVAVTPQMRIVEDKESSMSLLDIYKSRCEAKKTEVELPINRYYDKLAAVQAKGGQASHQVIRDVFREVQDTMVPKTLLKEWALSTFPNATNYWTFRKMMINQLAVLGLMEYALHLTRLFPEMMYIHKDSGLINVAYYKFNIDDAKGELDGNWPVPFRLTPNLSELATTLGVTGPLTATMIAAARCLAAPTLKANSFLRAILRDEVIAWHKRKENNVVTAEQQGLSRIEGDALVTRVSKAVSTIMARIFTLAQIDGVENKVSQLVRACQCTDNLCRMDPAWHPWL